MITTTHFIAVIVPQICPRGHLVLRIFQTLLFYKQNNEIVWSFKDIILDRTQFIQFSLFYFLNQTFLFLNIIYLIN